MMAMMRAIATREYVVFAVVLTAVLALPGCSTPHGPYSSHGVDSMRTFRTPPGLGGGGG